MTAIATAAAPEPRRRRAALPQLGADRLRIDLRSMRRAGSFRHDSDLRCPSPLPGTDLSIAIAINADRRLSLN